MYHCLITFVLFTHNPKYTEILRKINLPEDCSISFKDQSDSSNADCLKDTALIFDDIATYKENAALFTGDFRKVIMVSPEKAIEAIQLSNSVSDIWLLPSNEYDALLKFQAEKLVKAMKEAFDFRLQTISMTTAFDSIPDLVWFKDTQGAHLIVNNGFCEAVNKTKQQIYKMGHYYIWDIPKEEYDAGDYVCLESEEVVMNKRETCVFDEKVKTQKGMRQFITYKSPLIDIDGNIFGTCGIANDVTAQHNINSELEVVLDSMPFAILIEDDAGIVITKNDRFDEIFPDYSNITGKSSAQWERDVLGSYPNGGEIVVKVNGEEYVLISTERPVFSIFHEKIANAHLLIDVTKQVQSRQQSLLNANTDFLTGLYNRRMLFSHLESNKDSSTMAMITIDLDSFKQVNDTYGHNTGDLALIDTAQLLKDCFKSDFVARLGGDEFLVVITRDCTSEQVLDETQRFLEVLRSHFCNKKEFSIMTASAGVAVYTLRNGETHNFENLMKCSDKALYMAKKSGKNMCCVYEWS